MCQVVSFDEEGQQRIGLVEVIKDAYEVARIAVCGDGEKVATGRC